MTSLDDTPRAATLSQLLRGLVLEDISLRHLRAECFVKLLPSDVRVRHELREPTIVVETTGAIVFEHVFHVFLELSDSTQLGVLHIVMVCSYRAEDLSGLEPAQLQRYTPSSVIHVWPYLRELVSRTTADFGWPRLTLPTYNANP